MTLKLIVALDFSNQQDAFTLAEQLVPSRCALKIGSEMFTHFGPDFVRNLVKKGLRSFWI